MTPAQAIEYQRDVENEANDCCEVTKQFKMKEGED
jgi:hypothetical protein